MCEKHTLANGVRLLVDQDARFSSASIAFCLLGGSSDESRDNIGLTHLLEHVLFKRTHSRSTLDLANLIDELGGEINAFTDTDSLCLHADVTSSDVPQLLELFKELLLESAFTEEEVTLEREVIRQEIIEADDDPEQAVYNRFSERFWPNHSIGLPVAGYLETLGTFDRQLLLKRQSELLVGGRVLIAAAGNIDAEELLRFTEATFGDLPKGEVPVFDKPEVSAGLEVFDRPVNQVFVLFGLEAPRRATQDFLVANLVSTAFGGGMSSRLFQRLREQEGLAYDVSADLDTYSQTGAMLVNCTLERSNINRALPLLLGEFDSLASEGLKTDELERAKRFICSSLEMEVDAVSHRLWRALESELYYGRYVSAEEVKERFSDIRLEDVQNYQKEWLVGQKELLVLGGDVEKYVLPSALASRFSE